MMRWTMLMIAGLSFAACNRPHRQGYQAPRKPGESVLSWADALSSTGCSDCLEGQLECNHYYLGTKENWEGLPGGAANLYEYVALLDFDYDTKPVPIAPGQPPAWTQLKVRSVLEEYVNLVPGGVWDGIFVDGKCDNKGHCIMNEGMYPMPLWSGTSVVFGRVMCPRLDWNKYNVWVSEVYPVENDKIFDFFGFDYDWNEMREALNKAGEASKARPEPCSSVRPRPTPPSTGNDDGPSPDVGPFPDAGPFSDAGS